MLDVRNLVPLLSTVFLIGGFSMIAMGNAHAQDSGHHPHGPPPEAYEACVSKASGDACSVSFHGTTLAGTCAAPPPDATDTRLACRPTTMPPPPDGGAPPPS